MMHIVIKLRLGRGHLCLPTIKGVAHISTCSVELSEESTSRIISTSQKIMNHDSEIDYHSWPKVQLMSGLVLVGA